MGIPEPKRKPYRITDPKQRRIYERLLKLVDPCAAAFYHDAVELMETRPPYQAITHIVAHLIRDAQLSLLDIIEPLSPDPSVQRGATDVHKARIIRACSALGLDEDDGIVVSWLGWCGRGNTQGFHERAHRVTAEPPRPIDRGFLDWWNGVQYVFDAVLDRQEARFLAYIDTLDGLIALRAPTARDAAKLKKEVPTSFVAHRYFFDRVSSPAWLPLLLNEGYFSHPPSAVHDEERGIIEYPTWPQVRYLIRMSSPDGDPAAVCDIILDLPTIDNTYLVADLVQAVTVMPVEHARRTIPLVVNWIPQLHGMSGIDELGRLAARLAEAGDITCTLDLCSALLQVQCVQHGPRFKEAQSVIEPYHFETIVLEHLPEVITHVGEPILQVLCDVLDKAVAITASEYVLQTGDDHLYISCPLVESASSRHEHDIIHMLIACVRDAAMQLLAEKRISPEKLAEMLETGRWSIFHRILFHVLRVSKCADLGLITRILLDEHLLADSENRQHEYRLLLRERFCDLYLSTQLTLLGWIDDGPDVSYYQSEAYAKWLGREVTEEEILSYSDEWRLDRLKIISVHLSADRHKQYLDLKQKCENSHRDTITHLALVPRRTEQELAAMGVPELVECLRTWTPEQRPDRDDYEWIKRVLERMVAAAPERFADHVGLFINPQRPVYNEGILYGFRTALDNGKAFPWQPVLAWCKRVLEDPCFTKIVTTVDEQTVKYPYNSEAFAIAMLADKLFGEQSGLEYALRDQAWSVIAHLIANPVDSFSERDDDVRMSSMSRSTRDLAIEAAIHYAHWVKRSGYSKSDDSGMALVPEVRQALSSLVDPTATTPARTYAALGRMFPWLVDLDEQWSKDNLRFIFPRAKRRRQLRRAAWDACLKFHEPHPKAFRILKSEFRFSTNLLSASPPMALASKDGLPDDIAEHLMVYYWWGMIRLVPEHSLIKCFFRAAPDHLRAAAIKYVGWNFNRIEDDAPQEVISRLVDLWNWRMSEASSDPGVYEFAKELPEFGWWVKCGRFPRQWVLEQTRDVIRKVGRIDMQGFVFESMVPDLDRYPDLVLDCLEAILDASTEWDKWKLYPVVKPAQQILDSALQDRATHARALVLVNKFGSKDYITEFRDLADRYECDHG